MRLTYVAVLAGLACATPALAQKVREAPRRPRLDRDADTNSAPAYYQFGVRQLRENPSQAAAAFYWAARLDPETADYPYSRWIALVIARPELLRATRRGGNERAAEARALDSLMARAMILSPFVHRRLDDQLALELVERELGVRPGGQYEQEIEYALRQFPEAAALFYYSRGRFDDALRIWAEEARKAPHNPYVRAERGRAFALRGAFDSARVQMQEALGIARRRDADSSVFIYESKAAWEYCLGVINAAQGRNDSARAALERSLVEDLSYYPAHIQLGLLALRAADTTGALVEFQRAVEAREDEYLPRVTLAWHLARAGHNDSALVHLRRAVALEPFASAPQLMLGTVADGLGDRETARVAFEAFLQRATQLDPNRARIQARMAALRP